MGVNYRGILLVFPFLTFGFSFKYHIYLQGRYDRGELKLSPTGFQQKGDLYLRRVGAIFKFDPTKVLRFVVKLESVNLFRNYKGGKEEYFPKKVLVKKLYLKWEISKYLSLKLGRDKKPFSREGLNSSLRLLLVDKTVLFSEVKKFFGDYYAPQGEVIFQPKRFLKIYLATFYGWSVRDKNPFGKNLTIKPKRYWLNNFVGRVEFSPRGWEEKKKGNTTFGKRVFVLGFSYAYIGSMEYKRKRALGWATEGDLFFRSPKTAIGRFTAFLEYDRVKYNLSLLGNRSLEGFQTQLGFRPKFKPFGKDIEFGLGFEDIQKHPGRGKYIYEGALNLYPSKNLKLTLGVENVNDLKVGKGALTETLQVQYTF